MTRYKTLQLNFERQGERFSVDARDIKFRPPAEWIYRASSRNLLLESGLKNQEPGGKTQDSGDKKKTSASP